MYFMYVNLSFLVSVMSMLIAFTFPVFEARKYGFSIISDNLSDISAGTYSKKAANIFNVAIFVCSIALLLTSIFIYQSLNLWGVTSYLMVVCCISLGVSLFFPVDKYYLTHTATARIFFVGNLFFELLIILQGIAMAPVFLTLWILQTLSTALNARYMDGWTILQILHCTVTTIFYFTIIYFLM